MKIRFYKIDIYNLYNYKIFNDLAAIIYNNYLALTLSVCNSINCNENTDNMFTTLIFFSYINGTDYNINITSYFLNKDRDDNDDIYLNFPKNNKIDNNIFIK